MMNAQPKQKLPTSAGFEPNAFYERERIEHNHASRYCRWRGEVGEHGVKFSVHRRRRSPTTSS